MLHRFFSSCSKQGHSVNCGARASHCGGLSHCAGFSLCWVLLLLSTGSRARPAGAEAHGLRSCSSRALEHDSVAAAHRLSCSIACGVFPAQGSNPRLIRWQADSLPLSHQGSPCLFYSRKYSSSESVVLGTELLGNQHGFQTPGLTSSCTRVLSGLD